MTLLDIERLVRKIIEILQEPGNASIAPKLAEDFSAACHLINLRLQQCETMVKARDFQQALQMAETAPNLLDCVTALEFRTSDDWRTFCQQRGLPVADKIDARAVQTLNECYAQGISTDHPLYAAYRKAAFARNDEKALQALQSITRLNPGDTNAIAEQTRLDGKVLQLKLQQLGDVLAAGNPEVVVAQIEAIEGFGFKNQPEGEIWRNAQIIRCGTLLEKGETARQAANWMETLSLLDFIQRLRSEHTLELSPEVLKKVEQLKEWALGEQESYNRDREFQARVAELRYLIQQSEEKDTLARQVGLVEMKEDFENLHKVWRILQDFTRPIASDATAAFQKRSLLLEAEINRRTLIRKRALITGVIACLVIIGAASWATLAYFRTRDYAKQLNEAVTQRQVRIAEKLLETQQTYKKPFAFGMLSTATAAAESFVSKERNLFKNFEEITVKLPKELEDNLAGTELNKIYELLAMARTNLDALSPDLKEEHSARVKGFEIRWEKCLAERSTAINEMLEQWLALAETKCAALDYGAPVDQVRAQLASLSNRVFQITESETGFTNRLQIRSDLVQRAATIRTKYGAYDTELKKLDTGYFNLQKARATTNYSEALALMASSEFSTAPQVKAAMAMLAIGPNEETLLRFLLNATNASEWAFLNKEQPMLFVPETVFPGEQAFLNHIKQDTAIIGRHQRLRLWLDEKGTKVLEWIIEGTLNSDAGWHTINAYDPSSSKNACVYKVSEYGVFEGKFKLTPTQPIYRIETAEMNNETAAYNSIGLQDMGGETTYRKPLLEILDNLKKCHSGSPVFRAYLYLRLVEIMRVQPEAWGLAFAPAISADYNTINSIVDNGLNSGDWFVPAKINAYADRLDRFFSSVENISYTKQATGLVQLMREISKGGLQYVGFVGLDGQPVFADGAVPEEIWGYSITLKQPTLLGSRANVRSGFTEKAMPLSPLYKLSKTRAQFLEGAGVNPQAVTYINVLPWIFNLNN
ncbi:MAG: hypothetical protein WCO56_11250 [Verrucomicrobiota bacterium]